MQKYFYTLITTFFAFTIHSQETFSLDDAIAYAIENSNEMKLAELEVRESEAQIIEYRSIGLPKLNAGVDYNYYIYAPVNPVPDFITPSVYRVLEEEFPNEVTTPTGDPQIFEFSFFTKHNLTAKLDASLLLFDGSYLTGLKAAKLFRDLTIKKQDSRIENIKADVTKAYLNVLITEKNKEMLQKNMDNIDQSLTEAQAFYKEGFIEKLEVTRMELSQETLTTELENLDKLIAISKDLLKFQMSFPLDNEIKLNENLEQLVDELALKSDDEKMKLDFNNKAQYREILMGQALNELNLERLKRGYLPNVVARAGASEALQRNNLFDSDEVGWLPTIFAGLSINVPILDGQLKKSQISQAKIELDRTDIRKSEYERSIYLQATQALSSLSKAQDNLESRKRLLDMVQEIYETTLIKFREGVGNSVEVRQAEATLLQSQTDYINAIYDLLIAKTDLDISLGTL